MKASAIYVQLSGQLIFPDPNEANGAAVYAGYSGHGSGVNNPIMEDKPSVGPIPKGLYIVGLPHDHPRLGPCVMTLTPIDHRARDRSGFYVHGDNKAQNRTASTGCIIVQREARLRLAALSREASCYVLVI